MWLCNVFCLAVRASGCCCFFVGLCDVNSIGQRRAWVDTLGARSFSSRAAAAAGATAPPTVAMYVRGLVRTLVCGGAVCGG
jgi:hypothetical protein